MTDKTIILSQVYVKKEDISNTVEDNNNNPVSSDAVYDALNNLPNNSINKQEFVGYVEIYPDDLVEYAINEVGVNLESAIQSGLTKEKFVQAWKNDIDERDEFKDILTLYSRDIPNFNRSDEFLNILLCFVEYWGGEKTSPYNSYFLLSYYSDDTIELVSKDRLATIATSGEYNDLLNKPAIPEVVDEIQDGNNNAVTSNAVYDALNRQIDYDNSIVLTWKGKDFVSSSNTSTENGCHLSGTNMVIDWGDGTTSTKKSNRRFAHTYENNGTYIITITGDSITSLGSYCFYGCTGLINISIPSSITSIGRLCFSGCTNLIDIKIPSSITSISEKCFENCSNLLNIIIPLSITSIGNSCFAGCTNLTNIKIPSSITSIGSRCFNGCTNLTDIIISPGLTNISDYCFNNCTHLTNVIIPSSVTSIGSSCFNGCTGLTNIVIPIDVTYIGTYCFNDCTNLTEVIFKNPIPATIEPNPSPWGNVPTNCKVYIPASGLNSYKSASYYPDPSTYTYIGIPDEVTDEITDEDTRVVTSNAVYDGLTEIWKYIASLIDISTERTGNTLKITIDTNSPVEIDYALYEEGQDEPFVTKTASTKVVTITDDRISNLKKAIFYLPNSTIKIKTIKYLNN